MARQQEVTNSVIVTNVPRALFDPALMASLRLHFARVGQLRCWAPLPSFGRVLAVFSTPAEAKLAKTLLDKSIIDDAAPEGSEEEKIPRFALAPLALRSLCF